MAETNKRYYWLKLPEDFFRQKEIKQLRKIAGGDTFTIIYLKMLLRSLKDNGRLYYEGIEQDFVSELALDIDEDEENVKLTVAFLMSKGILVQSQSDEYEITTAEVMTGSEGYSAERMRRLREKKQLASLGDAPVTDCDAPVIAGDEEIEKRVREKSKSKSDTRKRGTFTPPTLEEVQDYVREKGWSANEFQPEYFVNFYASKGWMVGKNKMVSWKKAASGWVDRYRKEHPDSTHKPSDYDAPDDDLLFWR